MFLSEVGEDADEYPTWFEHIPAFSDLRSLCVTLPIPQQAGLDIFGRLPRLERLELTLLPEHFDRDQHDLLLSPGSFPCLKQVALYRLPDLKFFKALWKLDAVSTKLESVTIRFDKYRWSQLMGYQELFEMVTMICEHSSRIHDLALYPPYEGMGNETSEIIHTLLSSLPLTRLCFAPITPTVLYFAQYPRVYPKLRRLELNTPWTRLADLNVIAQSFPNLEYFVLKLTATSQEWDEARINPAPSNHSQPIELWVVDVFFSEEAQGGKANDHELESVISLVWPNARFLKKIIRG